MEKLFFLFVLWLLLVGPAEAQVNIPVGQWIALKLPKLAAPNGRRADLDAGAKHLTGAVNPRNGRIYWVGGDYNGAGSVGSYREFILSLNLTERFADRANVHAGWRIEYPECGGPPPQPKHPDFVGWQWDENRRVFWMVPGILESSTTNCPGETADKVDNPGYLHNFIMYFDPATQTWTKSWPATGARGFPTTSWWTVYDPVRDLLLRAVYWNTTVLDILDVKTGKWTYVSLGKSAVGREIKLWHNYLAVDYKARVFYGADSRLYRVSLDNYAVEDLGPIPSRGDEENKMVWDSVNQVLLLNLWPDKFYAYHYGKRSWETLTVASDVSNVIASGRIMDFDYINNAVVLWGQNSTDPRVVPSTPFMFVYRYGNGPR